MTREAARDDVQRILECNEFLADAVLNTRLVDFTDEGVERSERLVEHLEERRAQL